MCVGAGKWCLKIAREWSGVREQWGRPVARHEAVGAKIAFIAATTFALEAVVDLASQMADEDRNDIRIEAALAKLYGSEMACLMADELVQIRGGRGFETAESLAARGERAVPAEQMLRDLRINRIFEGSTEIMHLLIAREAVDAHLSVAATSSTPRRPSATRPGPAPGPPGSTPAGCPDWPPGPARCRAPTGSSTPTATPTSPPTCATSSGPPANSPDRRSTPCPVGRGGWRRSRDSSAGSWTSGPNSSR